MGIGISIGVYYLSSKQASQALRPIEATMQADGSGRVAKDPGLA